MRTIFFPGTAGQRCTAKYIITKSPFPRKYLFPSTALIFVEHDKNPGGTFCTFGGNPSLLVSRVLMEHLPGCAMELIEVYYAARQEEDGHQDIAKWKIVWPIPTEPDMRMYPAVDGVPFTVLHEPLPADKQAKIRRLIRGWRTAI